MLLKPIKASCLSLLGAAILSATLILPATAFAQTGDLSTNAVQFQKWKKWRNKLGYHIKLPSHLKLAKESTGSWEFHGPDYGLQIKTWRSPAWKSRSVAYHYYKQWHKTQNKRIIKETDITKYIKKSRAHGTMLEGTGFQNGNKLKFIFVGLSNPYTGVNLNLRFAWWDNYQANQRMDTLVERLLSQIEATGQTKPSNPFGDKEPFGKDPFGNSKPKRPSF